MWQCGWCGKKIAEGERAFTLGAKVTDARKLRPLEGRMIDVRLPASRMLIPAGVAAAGSQGKQWGWDLGFMACTRACVLSLQALLESESRMFEQVFAPRDLAPEQTAIGAMAAEG